MDVSHLLDGLNDAQRQAVASPLRPALVLAGAGSGKTRVLVHRVAWLIQVEGASPRSILAVTFTNKAAAEMRGRIETLLGYPGGALWIGTFHGLAHRLLRLHWREAGLPQGFQILDSEDQARLMRKVLKALDLDEARWVPREILWFINAQKDEGLRPKHIKDTDDPTRRQLIRIYQAYEDACQRAGVVDFAELLLRAYELWRDNPALLQHYRERFRHVLVDEFQDTNAIQYRWLTLLAGPAGLPFAVGDDDQSIYRWRGARVENLNQFHRDYPQAGLYKLEQNYRSSGTILKAANALIAHNAGRVGKTLWTSGDDGERVKLYAAFNERDEADFVVNRIRDWVERGGARREVAVLYRSNAQSRVFEEAFLNARMPYRVYGGLRFFERAEIKDALAYLRLAANRADDTSFERVVNLPVRGIGAKTLEVLRDTARSNATPLWTAAGVCMQNGLAQRAAGALQGFMLAIDKMAEEIRGLELHQQVDLVIQKSGLIEHFKKEKGERGEGRVENLLELVSAARGFSPENDAVEHAQMQPLESFLAHAVLESGEGQADPYRRLRADDDPAFGQGPGISRGISRGHGGRLVPASALGRRSGRARGGAPPVLRRRDPRHAPSLYHLRGTAPSLRRGSIRPAFPVHQRTAARIAGGGPAATADIPTGVRQARRSRGISGAGHADGKPGAAPEIRRGHCAQFRGQRAAGPHPGEF